jgi:hypothetical protein
MDSHIDKLWTREAILFALRKWAHEYGEAPRSTDWNRASLDHPTKNTVRDEFGTWNKGVRAAGLRPRSRGVTGHLDPDYAIEQLTGAARARCRR